MPTIYYEKNSVKVTDTVFVTPRGDQYPVRNISSVAIRRIDNKNLFFACVVLVFLGILASPSNSYRGSWEPTIFLTLAGFACLYLWHKSKRVSLKIGSGGIIQDAITFPDSDEFGNKVLIEIADAINDAISNLQKT